MGSPRIVSIVGTRPHLTKLASVAAAFQAAGTDHLVVHTGQHYDPQLSDVFEAALGLPEYHTVLSAGRRPIQLQWAYLLEHLPPLLNSLSPDLVLVYGDTTTTAAAAVAAKICKLPVAHVEAGLREHDFSVPEEVNKRIVDGLSSLFLCPSLRAVEQLRAEGITRDIYLTGDTALDLLQRPIPEGSRAWFEQLGLPEQGFALCTFHREANTEDLVRLRGICMAISRLPLCVVVSLHPRTRGALERADIGLGVGSSRVDLQACKLEYSIVSPK